ncbi:hypothetical protein SAMN04489712_119119 [Thermomonospora echinospora]|uniref:Secreted protein n=1 Tax=Thermomonospora echinospora TaxID=1992 RepID=A0A1H6DPL5_9ACTN|nr:hypothetical protein [Thermomonospora echinospora]SEG86586.1 hypothetical protein SAMN04489712_119119 [Thermomonospora echinospora]
MTTKTKAAGQGSGKLRRAIAAGGAVLGAMTLPAVSPPAAFADPNQTCGDRQGVCIKIAREGTSVDFAQAYHDGRTGDWEGKIDLTREGFTTIQGPVGRPPGPATQNHRLVYQPGARICARGFELPGWRAKGVACLTV